MSDGKSPTFDKKDPLDSAQEAPISVHGVSQRASCVFLECV